MAARHTRHFALTEPLARFVDRQLAQGHYVSASELVRAALRLLERQQLGEVPATLAFDDMAASQHVSLVGSRSSDE